MKEKEFKISTLPDKVLTYQVVAFLALHFIQPILEENGMLVGCESFYDALETILIYLCVPVIPFVEVYELRKALKSGNDAVCRAAKRHFLTVSVLFIVLSILLYIDYFVL